MIPKYTMISILKHQKTHNFSKYDTVTAETDENHILIIEDEQGRKELSLENPVYSLGRDRNCNIRLISQFVSRRHATLVRLPKQTQPNSYYYRIVDGDAYGRPSSNGITINGHKISAHNLKHGDEICFGPKIRAIYYILKNSTYPGLRDIGENDITLTNPVGNEEIST